jgi:hypothetical protein
MLHACYSMLAEQAIVRELLQKRYLWNITLRKRGVYAFVSTEEQGVEVEGVRLSPSDRLEYVEQESKGRYVFMAIDMDGSPEVVIEERLLKVSPVKYVQS